MSSKETQNQIKTRLLRTCEQLASEGYTLQQIKFVLDTMANSPMELRNNPMLPAGPKHKHTCESCVFLGKLPWRQHQPNQPGQIDLYACPKITGLSSLLVRFSSKPSDYASVPLPAMIDVVAQPNQELDIPLYAALSAYLLRERQQNPRRYDVSSHHYRLIHAEDIHHWQSAAERISRRYLHAPVRDIQKPLQAELQAWLDTAQKDGHQYWPAIIRALVVTNTHGFLIRMLSVDENGKEIKIFNPPIMELYP